MDRPRTKRGGEIEAPAAAKAKNSAKAKEKKGDDVDSEELSFEDPYEDELEEEDEQEVRKALGNMEVDEGDDDPEDDEEEEDAQVWRPGVDALEPGQELEYDSSAYVMLHKMNLEWSCLSFDVIRDNLGVQRTVFPHTVYFTAGTQAEGATNNKLYLLKVSQLCRTKHDDDPEGDDSSEDDDTDDDPVLEHRWVTHPGGVNRVRAMPQKPGIVCSWSEQGFVHMWNLTKHLHALDNPGTKVANTSSIMSYKHTTEGFAMDWSKLTEGRLVTGDCNGQICLWQPNVTSWTVTPGGFQGSGGSVEDLQWSPTEDTVFASCGVDQHLRVWDIRTQRQGIAVQAHNADINVISWNRTVSYMMISGCDDGSFKIWDLRNFKPDAYSAHFRYHKGAITSVEWDPNDQSQFAVSAADNRLTVWDLSLERDTEVEAIEKVESQVDVPPQLLFEHMGQQDMKELHWYPQIPGVVMCTAADGFDIFKPATEIGPEDVDE